MRIIAGEYRGNKINTPLNYEIRPTMDRSKEGLFNCINQEIYNSSFLDLFSGTGSIAIEAVSRGSKRVVSVDKNQQSINLINENNKLVDNKVIVIKLDVINYLEKCKEKFDYIFLDPPYDIEMEFIYEIIKCIKNRELLELNGKIIVELSKEIDIQDDNICKIKKYGKSKFTFINKE